MIPSAQANLTASTGAKSIFRCNVQTAANSSRVRTEAYRRNRGGAAEVRPFPSPSDTAGDGPQRLGSGLTPIRAARRGASVPLGSLAHQ